MRDFPHSVQDLIEIAEVYSGDGAPFTAADRLSLAAERLRECAIQKGYPSPPAALKPMDADIEHLLENLGLDVEVNEDFECPDGEMSSIARRMETTARRLVREAGYVLPETPRGE
jgi:hypothetical protein